MYRLLGGVLVLLFAGCGAGQNAAATTPVLADTKGTYRLVSSGSSVTAPGGVNSFVSYSSGTLKLDDTDYALSLSGNRSSQQSSGVYRLGTSVNTILNARQGAFTLTATDPPFIFTGSYLVTRDFTLTLNYDPFSTPDGELVTHSETWFKESDALRHP
jgi:hypothetical protein